MKGPPLEKKMAKARFDFWFLGNISHETTHFFTRNYKQYFYKSNKKGKYKEFSKNKRKCHLSR